MRIFEFKLKIVRGENPRTLWTVAEDIISALEILDLPITACYQWDAHRIGRGPFDFEPTLTMKENDYARL